MQTLHRWSMIFTFIFLCNARNLHSYTNAKSNLLSFNYLYALAAVGGSSAGCGMFLVRFAGAGRQDLSDSDVVVFTDGRQVTTCI